MKNLLRKMSSITLSLVMVLSISLTAFAQSPSTNKVDTEATYEVKIGDTTLTLKEGEKAKVPLNTISDTDSGIQPNVIFVGDAGTLDIWPGGGKVHYTITMTIPATSFSGRMSIMDLTYGLSGGNAPVTGFSGAVNHSNYYLHRYSASLDGTAYYLGNPVATVAPNYITWINDGVV